MGWYSHPMMQFNRWLLTPSVLLLLSCGEITPQRPNVLIYVVSSLRADALGVYDSSRTDTPHFDEFAADGVIFEEAYASSAWARPALASLVSGLYPWNHDTNRLDDRLPADIPNLAREFSANGYTSGLITANPDVGPLFGFDEGFDESIELYTRSTPGRIEPLELIATSDVVTEVALKWIEERPRPFFLMVLAVDPHAPYLPPRDHDPARFRAASGVDGRIASLERLSDTRTAADEDRIRELYQAEVNLNDKSFGRLISELRRTNQLDQTIVVLTGDHGESFWEYDLHGHRNDLSQEVLHVPLILRYPKDRRLPAGARTQAPMASVDLAPTLFDLTRLPTPSDLDGRSFFDSASQARPPILAGLRTSSETLLAAMYPPYKLLWDRNKAELSFFDMRVTLPEAEPFDPRSNAAADEARKDFLDALGTSLTKPLKTPIPGRTDFHDSTLTPDLKALGYDS